ncbi:MAG: SulP family inorganic anion transporter [Proteobacteria bacterium]|nr:SulP family inorganic anion transporter [Pseudomonadota bacterium]
MTQSSHSHSHSMQQSKFNDFKQDLLASSVVFFIALPLSLGIALASGAPPVTAMVAAIVGGILVGLISGAPLVVTGPAAGLSAMVLQYVQSYGIEKLFIITIMAGVFQMFLAAARAGFLVQRIPKTVIEGVLSAIGFMIVISQMHIFLGQAIPGNPIKNLIQLPNAIANVFTDSTGTFATATGIAVLGFSLLFIWPKIAGKFKWIPAALPAVLIATFASLFVVIPRLSIAPIGDHAFKTFADTFSASNWQMFTLLAMPAIGLAIVASAESLLTAKSVDIMATKRHMNVKFNVNRELFAQGVGNAVSGMFGGLPMTGVMVRSAANIDAGARTRASTVMHALWIALFIIFAPQVLSHIPLAALASILIFTGIKLINVKHMIEAVRQNAKEAWVWPATGIAILSTDLLKGLIIGIVFAIFNSIILRMTASKYKDTGTLTVTKEQTE